MDPHIILVKTEDQEVDVLRSFATKEPIFYYDEERANKVAKRLNHTGAVSEYIVAHASILFEERV